ncbi:stage 0 sporulation protein J [Peptoniphilus sp. ING2-D1G]|nr:stage 0 sporulation protein J [Peptoniphilus sp. ING2-D1G]
MKKITLGRGISNFIKDSNAVEKLLKEDASTVDTIKIKDIVVNESQARKHFDEDSLQELANSIKEFGIIQPLILRKKDDKYMIVAGERRFRAAKLVDLEEVPAIIKDISDENADKISLIENVQRKDLNPIEEAAGYKNVIDSYGITQEQLAKALGKSRQYIGNTMRLLRLDERVIEFMKRGLLSPSHGKILLAIKDKERQYSEAKRIVNLGNTVKETTYIIKNKRQRPESDIYIEKAKRDLSDVLGTKVMIKNTGKKKNIVIEYYNDEDLSRIYEKIIGSDFDAIF